MAVAVGLTPEMLPMIVTVCLSKGALGMSRKKVIIKRLNSIQNLGAMDVLCTDKTGTLTQNRMTIVELRAGDSAWRRDSATGLSGDAGDRNAPPSAAPVRKFAFIKGLRGGKRQHQRRCQRGGSLQCQASHGSPSIF